MADNFNVCECGQDVQIVLGRAQLCADLFLDSIGVVWSGPRCELVVHTWRHQLGLFKYGHDFFGEKPVQFTGRRS